MIVYLSRGGGRVGNASKSDWDQTKIRKKILKYAPDTMFATSVAGVDFVVIPDDAKPLKRVAKKTQTQELTPFLKMLKAMHTKKSEKKSPKEMSYWDTLAEFEKKTKMDRVEKTKTVKKDEKPTVATTFAQSLLEKTIGGTDLPKPFLQFKKLDKDQNVHEEKPVQINVRRKITPIHIPEHDADKKTESLKPPTFVFGENKPKLIFGTKTEVPQEKEQTQKPTITRGFSCRELMDILKENVPNGDVSKKMVFDSIQATLSHLDSSLVDRIADIIHKQIKKDQEKAQFLDENGGDDDAEDLEFLKSDKHLQSMLKIQQKTEHEMDRVLKDAFEEFDMNEHSKEDYNADLEELLESLKKEMKTIMETAQEAPSKQYLIKYAKAIVSKEPDMTEAEKSKEIDRLYLEWNEARDEIRYKQFALIEPTDIQANFTEKVLNLVHKKAKKGSTTPLKLFTRIAKIIAKERTNYSNDDVFRNVQFDEDLLFNIEELFGWSRKEINPFIAKLWQK